MANVLYALLLIFGGFATGCAVVGAVVSWKLARKGARMSRHAVPLLAGIILSQGVLVVRLVQLGETTPSGAAWLYVAGLAVQSYGLLMTTAFAVERLSEYEAHANGKTHLPVSNYPPGIDTDAARARSLPHEEEKRNNG